MTVTKVKSGIEVIGVRPLGAVRRLAILPFFILLGLLTHCSDEDPISTDIGLNFFPLHKGNNWVYEVKETTIVQSVTEVYNYELRVTVIDSVKNVNNGYTYTLQREKRTLETEAWESFETWTAEVTGNKLIQNESNVLFVKLAFPIYKGGKWNGNEFNNLPNTGNLFNGSNSDVYNIFEFDQSVSLSTGLDFSETATVHQNSFTDAIVGKDERKEIYARDVGLVYKEITQLEYCSTPNCLGQQKVDKGVILIQTLKSYASQ